jgi:hypothetical protein
LRLGDVLVANRGFCSYTQLALLVQAGVHTVFRMHQKHIVNFTPERPHGEPRARGKGHKKGQPRAGWLPQRGQHDLLVHWLKPLAGPQWTDEEQCAHLPALLEVRERQYQGQKKGFRVTQIPLVTTLLDATLYPVAALAQLSYARWGMATNCAHLQTPMGLKVLKCKTVDGVLKELIVFALIDPLVRMVLIQAARRQQVDIDRISFIAAARRLAAVRDGPAGACARWSSIRFTDVQARPSACLALPSLTLDACQQFVPPFETACQAHLVVWRLDGKPRITRWFTVSQYCPVPTQDARRFCMLVSLKP